MLPSRRTKWKLLFWKSLTELCVANPLSVSSCFIGVRRQRSVTHRSIGTWLITRQNEWKHNNVWLDTYAETCQNTAESTPLLKLPSRLVRHSNRVHRVSSCCTPVIVTDSVHVNLCAYDYVAGGYFGPCMLLYLWFCVYACVCIPHCLCHQRVYQNRQPIKY